MPAKPKGKNRLFDSFGDMGVEEDKTPPPVKKAAPAPEPAVVTVPAVAAAQVAPKIAAVQVPPPRADEPPPVGEKTPDPGERDPPVLDDTIDLPSDEETVQASAERKRKRKKRNEAEFTHMTFRIETELRNHFHIACRLQNEVASELLRDFVKKYVAKNMTLPTR